jgi:hypothetical protein
MYTRTHAHTHVRTHAHTHTHTHTHARAHTHTCARTRTHARTHLPDANGEVPSRDEAVVALVEPFDAEGLVVAGGGAAHRAARLELGEAEGGGAWVDGWSTDMPRVP